MAKIFFGTILSFSICNLVRAQSQNREIDLNLFLSNTQITGNGKDEQEKCAAIVYASRQSLTGQSGDSLSGDNDTTFAGWTTGVKPTVSLKTALLIFCGVGFFAVAIATLFQMVSAMFPNLLIRYDNLFILLNYKKLLSTSSFDKTCDKAVTGTLF